MLTHVHAIFFQTCTFFPDSRPPKDVPMKNARREEIESALERTHRTSERQILLKQLWKLANTSPPQKEKKGKPQQAECVLV